MAHFIKDADRSAFGLGWEYARAELGVKENPFQRGEPQYDWFTQGFEAFCFSPFDRYEDPLITGPE